jgi:regulator of protease activity HflC (stomatin/prohibitin superfamily)
VAAKTTVQHLQHVYSWHPKVKVCALQAEGCLQVTQWKAEALRLEEVSANLTKELQDAQAAISKSRIKQEALQVQATLRKLQAERAQAAETHSELQDPRAAAAAAQAEAQRAVAALDALKADVKDLAATVREREGAAAALHAHSSGSRRVAIPNTDSGTDCFLPTCTPVLTRCR